MFHKYLLKMSKKWKVRIMTLLQNQIGRNVWNLCTFSTLKYLFCFFLVYHQVSLSEINGQNTQNIFISKGCQKKDRQCKTLRQGRLWYYVTWQTFYIVVKLKTAWIIKSVTTLLRHADKTAYNKQASALVLTLWDVSKLARNNNLSI